ncbi:DNA polymerase III subunit chi [Alphaproteobacteria bacterium]|jgi:DNA polymerase-3 subunit chi|nr:DNA polymerase III subunit chi [Alphaproteobacteria bacterium]
MRQIDFYQIGQAGLEPVLLMLLKKTLAAKKKALILCPVPAASALDDALWSHDADSWIAHGLGDADGAEHCNVWISSDMAANPIKAEFLFLLHGSVPTTWDGIARSFYLFGGRSDAQLQQARDQWKEWQGLAESKLGYFSQNAQGGWDKMA